MLTLIPAYGRNYLLKEEVLKDWNLRLDFLSRGGYINNVDAFNGGLKEVLIDYGAGTIKISVTEPVALAPVRSGKDSEDEILAASAAAFDDASDSDLESWVFDSVVPTACPDGCEVEPDGRCCHGYPSALVFLGII